jgi:hypothetical protein
LLAVIPFLHDFEPSKPASTSVLRYAFDYALHFGPSRSGDNPWGVLQVHQDDIDPLLLQKQDAAADHPLVGANIVAPQDGISADLPNHQVRMRGDDVFSEAEDLLADILATHATVQNLDLDVWETFLQLLFQAARVAHSGRTRADTLG